MIFGIPIRFLNQILFICSQFRQIVVQKKKLNFSDFVLTMNRISHEDLPDTF